MKVEEGSAKRARKSGGGKGDSLGCPRGGKPVKSEGDRDGRLTRPG